jgi:hypothetical protein
MSIPSVSTSPVNEGSWRFQHACGQYPCICIPSAAVKHISSEAEIPLTIIKEVLSAVDPRKTPQHKSIHARDAFMIPSVKINLRTLASNESEHREARHQLPITIPICKNIYNQNCHVGFKLFGLCQSCAKTVSAVTIKQTTTKRKLKLQMLALPWGCTFNWACVMISLSIAVSCDCPAQKHTIHAHCSFISFSNLQKAKL